ncbi:MAG: isocitrate lyase/PEP mutase family protein [Mycetocola sp.]
MSAPLSEKKSTRLKRLFSSPETVLMPFGALPVHAQMAERAGFPAFELSGGLAAWWSGVPDVGYLTMTEIVQHAKMVARAVDIPVYCDADTGYGAPVNVKRTTEEFIQAGVAGIHIEDQREPKKAGGEVGIELVSDAEAVGRLRAAIDARDRLDPDFVIVARTDGYGAAGGSLDEAIRRARLYKEEAGVDVVFFEGLLSWDDVRIALSEVPGPAYAIASGMKAGPAPSVSELTRMGQTINIVNFVSPGIQEVWNLLLEVRESGELAPIDEYMRRVKQYEGVHFTGRGDGFTRPTPHEVRELEELYLPPEMQRDYLNTLNA